MVRRRLNCCFALLTVLPAATSDSDRQSKDRWINLNAWTATLVATIHTKGLPSPDFSLYGIWTIRMALEEPDISDVALETAAMWFVHASPCIHRLCQDGKQFDGKVAKPGSLFRDREWRGFSLDRWRAWLGQMNEYGASGSEDRIGKAVADAVRAMEAVG